MIPTAFSAASAIYCEIGDKPADEFVYCPNAFPALRQVSVQSIMYIPRGVTSMHHPLGGHLTRCTCRSVAGRCKDATPVTARHQKECAGDVELTQPAL
jgi:hypothetical protein